MLLLASAIFRQTYSGILLFWKNCMPHFTSRGLATQQLASFLCISKIFSVEDNHFDNHVKTLIFSGIRLLTGNC